MREKEIVDVVLIEVLLKCGKDIKGTLYINMRLAEKLRIRGINGVYFCKKCNKEV